MAKKCAKKCAARAVVVVVTVFLLIRPIVFFLSRSLYRRRLELYNFNFWF